MATYNHSTDPAHSPDVLFDLLGTGCSAPSNASCSSNTSDEATTDEAVTGVSGLPFVYHKENWSPEVIQRIVTLALIMMLTLFGNVIIVIVLTCSKYRKLNSRVNIFIINLAFGDLTVCFFTMPVEVLFVVFEEGWVMGAVACKILLYVQIVTLASTTFILVAMSFDRFLAMCRPLSLGTQRARRMIIVAWIMAFVFASPQLLIFEQVPVGVYPDGEVKYKCKSSGYTAKWQRKLYFTTMTLYILVVPTAIICFCYINVVRVVWAQGKESTSRDGVSLRKAINKDSKVIPRAKIKTIKMTLSIICSFIFCWTPYFVVHLIRIWSDYTYTVPDSVIVYAETMACLNSALNPILYGCFNIKMKRGLFEVFCPQRLSTRDKANKCRKVTNFVSLAQRTASADANNRCSREPVSSLNGNSTGSGGGGAGTARYGGIGTGAGGLGGGGLGMTCGASSGAGDGKSREAFIKEENVNGVKLRVRFIPESNKNGGPEIDALLSTDDGEMMTTPEL